MGYSPWGPKESDMPEQLNNHMKLVTTAFDSDLNDNISRLGVTSGDPCSIC